MQKFAKMSPNNSFFLQSNFFVGIIISSLLLFSQCKKEETATTPANNSTTTDPVKYDFSPFYAGLIFVSSNCNGCYYSQPPHDAMMAATDSARKKFLLHYHILGFPPGGFPEDPVGTYEYKTLWDDFCATVAHNKYTPMVSARGAGSTTFIYTGQKVKEMNKYVDSCFTFIPEHAIYIELTSAPNDLTKITGKYSIKNKLMQYDLADVQIRFALTEDSIKFNATKGENAGRAQIINHAVRADMAITPDASGEGVFEMTGIPSNAKVANCTLVAFVETNKGTPSKINWGKIKAASSIDLVK